MSRSTSRTLCHCTSLANMGAAEALPRFAFVQNLYSHCLNYKFKSLNGLYCSEKSHFKQSIALSEMCSHNKLLVCAVLQKDMLNLHLALYIYILMWQKGKKCTYTSTSGSRGSTGSHRALSMKKGTRSIKVLSWLT